MSAPLPFGTCLQWYKQLVAVAGFPLYTIERSFSWQEEGMPGWSFTYSRVLVCPRCLKQWAHLAFQNSEPGGGLPLGCLEPTGVFCGDCGPGREGKVAGSLLDAPYSSGVDLPLLYALPEPLLRREFELHLKHYEREISGHSSV